MKAKFRVEDDLVCLCVHTNVCVLLHAYKYSHAHIICTRKDTFIVLRTCFQMSGKHDPGWLYHDGTHVSPSAQVTKT